MTIDEIDFELPEGLCLLNYRGSIAHDMYVPQSDPNHIDDIDLIGIVFAPQEHYLGFTEWGSRGTMEYRKDKWDVVYYEIRKAFELLLKGNPNIMSLLWTDPQHIITSSIFGQALIDNRDLFRGRHVFHAFAGYADAQLQKMELRDPGELRDYLAVTAVLKSGGRHPNHIGEVIPLPADFGSTGEERNAMATSHDKLLQRLRHYQKKGDNIGYMGDKRKRSVLKHGFDAKNAAHCIRLLRMCIEYLETGVMIVKRPDAAELLEIKRGDWTLEQIKEHAKALFTKARVAYDNSSLPDGPNKKGAEEFLVSLLRAWLKRPWIVKCYQGMLAT